MREDDVFVFNALFEFGVFDLLALTPHALLFLELLPLVFCMLALTKFLLIAAFMLDFARLR